MLLGFTLLIIAFTNSGFTYKSEKKEDYKEQKAKSVKKIKHQLEIIKLY